MLYSRLHLHNHLNILSVFFFNHPATTEIYTLSLHDALPIYPFFVQEMTTDLLEVAGFDVGALDGDALGRFGDRKSTRLNSSHTVISYAVFCLKKKITAKPLRGSTGGPIHPI